MACLGLFKNRPKKGAAERGPSKSSPPGSAAATRSSTNGSSVGRRTSPSRGSAPSPRSMPALFKERAHGLRVFNLDELRKATNDFNKMLKIGEGGFGSVYKGYIRRLDGEGDRMPVAIKRLNSKGLQGHKQWLAEVQFLGVVAHPNLVKLIGYCSTDGERGVQRLLVYEFMPNKSLEDHLFNPAYPALSWNLRLQIALGAAQGLAYLHEGLEVQVIYRDFKASNVLLDKEFKPKLSDFGLAREGPEDGRSHVTTAVVGTYGYAAPEYIETGHLTVKSDIWSFGVFLFEFLTGRRSLEPKRPSSEQKLLHWVRQFPVDSRKFSMIIDPRLRNGYSLAAAQEAAKLASSCLVKNPKDRPSMNEVVECLKRIIQMEVTKGVPSASTSDKLRNTALQKTLTV